MNVFTLIFWVCLIIAGLSLLFGYPEERRFAWGIALACAVIDLAVLGFKFMQS